MMSVVNDWKYSCEHNLSNTSINRISWVGQAACAYAINSSENIVRFAWWKLTDEEKNRANEKAKNAINYWEENICQK
jgi:hypothetical protein